MNNTTTLADELLGIIRDAIRQHPRSQQTRIGPSEIGHPCDRWISHKLAGTPEVNDRGAPWLPTVGTAVHAWLEDLFSALTIDDITAGRQPRWLLERRVTIGRVAGVDIDGQCDLFEILTGTSVDWKTCGKTRLDKYRRHGPDPDYRVQGHCYGRGWQLAGYAVHTVAICFLPRNAELDQTVWWSEPYDEQVAIRALARAEAIGMAAKALGPAVHSVMSTVDHNCGDCPYMQLNATDLTRACPGDPARPKRTDSTYSLVAPTSHRPVQAEETAR